MNKLCSFPCLPKIIKQLVKSLARMRGKACLANASCLFRWSIKTSPEKITNPWQTVSTVVETLDFAQDSTYGREKAEPNGERIWKETSCEAFKHEKLCIYFKQTVFEAFTKPMKLHALKCLCFNFKKFASIFKHSTFEVVLIYFIFCVINKSTITYTLLIFYVQPTLIFSTCLLPSSHQE